MDVHVHVHEHVYRCVVEYPVAANCCRRKPYT
jgi:hypothetical protein